MLFTVMFDTGNCLSVSLRSQKSIPDILKAFAAMGYVPISWDLETETAKEAQQCMKNFIKTMPPCCKQ